MATRKKNGDERAEKTDRMSRVALFECLAAAYDKGDPGEQNIAKARRAWNAITLREADCLALFVVAEVMDLIQGQAAHEDLEDLLESFQTARHDLDRVIDAVENAMDGLTPAPNYGADIVALTRQIEIGGFDSLTGPTPRPKRARRAKN